MALGAIAAGLQVIATEVTVGGGAGGSTRIVAWPEMEVFWVLVATTVMVPVLAGAVNRPLGLTVPALADHMTAGL